MFLRVFCWRISSASYKKCMETLYRVTPKNRKWIVQRIADRKTMHKPFIKRSEAAAYELELLAKAPQANGKTSTKTILEGYQMF